MNLVYEQFNEMVKLMHNNIAISNEKNNITYDQLENLASKVAFTEKDRGKTVCLWIPNSLEYVACYLACAKNDMKCLLLDSRMTYQEVQHIIYKYHPDGVIVDSYTVPSLLLAFENFNIEIISEKELLKLDNKISFINLNLGEIQNEILLNNVFNVLYSSGTTGDAKGIMYSAAQIVKQVHVNNKYFKLGEKDNVLCTVEMSHSYGIFDHVLLGLLNGATVYIMKTKFLTISNILKKLSECNITFFGSMPWVYKEFLNIKKHNYDISKVKYLICGGDYLSEEVQMSFFEKYNNKITQVYGLTELGYLTINLHKERTKSIGRMIDEIEYEIREGVLWVKADLTYMSLGYVGKQMYVDGWFNTNDCIDIASDGYCYFMNRAGDIINIRGNKIEPKEIENLLGKFPEIKTCVFGEFYGELILLLVLNKGFDRKITLEHVNTIIKQKLAKFKWPDKIIAVDSLPVTSLGKLNRKEILKKYEDIIENEN